MSQPEGRKTLAHRHMLTPLKCPPECPSCGDAAGAPRKPSLTSPADGVSSSILDEVVALRSLVERLRLHVDPSIFQDCCVAVGLSVPGLPECTALDPSEPPPPPPLNPNVFRRGTKSSSEVFPPLQRPPSEPRPEKLRPPVLWMGE